MPNYLTPGVYVEEIPAQSKPIEGVGTSIAAFVGLAPGGPVNAPMRIANWTQFARTYAKDPEDPDGPFMAGAYLAHAVYGFFQNGGTLCWVVRVGAGEGADAPQAALPAAGDRQIETFRALALEGADGEISVELSAESPPGDAAAQPTYRLVVTAGPEREEFDGLTLKKSRSNIVTKVNAGSKLIRLEETGASLPEELRLPEPGTYKLAIPTIPAGEIEPGHFEGDVARREGMGALAAVDEVTMLCCPDLMTLVHNGDEALVRDLQGKIIASLRGSQGSHGDPRRPSGEEAAAGHSRVAQRRRLRLEVRHTLLPLARGAGSAHAEAAPRASIRTHRGHLGPDRRHSRRA